MTRRNRADSMVRPSRPAGEIPDREALSPEFAARMKERLEGSAKFTAAFGVPPSETALQDWVTAQVAGRTGEEITARINELFALAGSGPELEPTDPVALVPWQQAQALLMGARLGWYSQSIMTYGYLPK